MDNTSCIEEGTISTTDSISLSPTKKLNSSVKNSNSTTKLCRMGSGTSVVLDTENGVEAESRKLPSSQYKGVVPQPNGRWGAQIYEKHQRVWLGTFNEEEEAAKTYDIAVQRFRGRDAVTNFKSSIINDDEIESIFLNSRSKAEIVDMLRKHTYNDELAHNKRNYTSNMLKNNVVVGGGGGSYLGNLGLDPILLMKSRTHLFEKSVTPSDVGKLNRLVIPKQHAEKHFPLQINGSNSSKGILLNFEDNEGKVWRFRYSYWNSSQSYVLTKGWSRFVKEKCLKAGHVVSFQRSTGQDKQLYIDWKPRINDVSTGITMMGLGTQQRIVPVKPVQTGHGVVRLFGVNIFKEQVNSDNSKRMRENDIQVDKSLSSSVDYSCKKQCIVVAL